MNERAVAISLKIPDNAAHTAQSALRRLGVQTERLERSEIWTFVDDGEAATLASRVQANEAVFNPNKHRLTILDAARPRPGEVWIEELRATAHGVERLGGKGIAGIREAKRYVGWRFQRADGSPDDRRVLEDAVERLLCNPAIERALFEETV